MSAAKLNNFIAIFFDTQVYYSQIVAKHLEGLREVRAWLPFPKLSGSNYIALETELIQKINFDSN